MTTRNKLIKDLARCVLIDRSRIKH